MKPYTLVGSTAIAILLGVVQMYFLVFCWGYIAAHSHMVHWLVELGLQHGVLRGVLLPIDFIISLFLSMPVAFALIKLRPAKVGTWLVCAVVPSFLGLNYPLVSDPLLGKMWLSFVPGWASELLALPLAVWLLYAMLKPHALNKVLQSDMQNVGD